MICTCPKCSAQIEADEPASPDKGGTAKCPECGSRFWAQQEAFVLRAYRKDWKIFCSSCGNEVGSETFCQGCATPFPDYWVVQASKPSRRYPYQPAFALDFSLGSRRRRPGSYGYAGEETSATSGIRSMLVLVVLLAALVAGVLGAGYYFLGEKSSRNFTQDYVYALYGVKSGADMCVAKVTQAAAKGGLTSQDYAEIDTVKAEVDAALQKLADVPPDYASATEQLNRLNAIYAKLYAQSKASASLADMKQLEGQFTQAALALKAALPEDLADQLRKDSVKYRSLQFLVQ